MKYVSHAKLLSKCIDSFLIDYTDSFYYKFTAPDTTKFVTPGATGIAKLAYY